MKLIGLGGVSLLLCLATAGCGGPAEADRPVVELQPVRGQLLVDGKPAPGALVTLHPRNQSALGFVSPFGEVAEDGSFTITTYEPGDGAPAGEYTATVSWPVLLNPGRSEPEYGPEQLPPHYLSPDSSGLGVVIVAGTAELPTISLTTR